MKGLFEKYKVILAPMAGITDKVFRQISTEYGADLTFTEMVSAKGLSYANDKTRHLVDVGDNESEVAVQVFGHEADIMAEQATWIAEQLGERLVLIDVNMGCPAKKIVKKGDGAALMLEPGLAAELISSMKRAVNVPVTAKFRRGYHEGDENATEFAKRLEEAGADALTVHGRFATQMYRGKSDRGCIARVKRAVSVPVVGNGDVKCASDATSLLDETGCDAIMVARGAIGNPWIFDEIKETLEDINVLKTHISDPVDKLEFPPSIEDRLAMLDRHAKMLEEQEDLDIKKMRKLAPFYIKGIDGAAKARGALSTCSTYADFKEVIDDLAERVRQ